jgi:hypothetical protein
LRSEWWKALENFKNECGNLQVIALTATPPYDSTPAMWDRYMSMCGEIDEEIAKMAEMYKMEVEKLKEYMGEAEKEQMKADMAVQEAVTLLVESSVEE